MNNKQKTCIYCGNVVQDYNVVIFKDSFRDDPKTNKKSYTLCNNCNQYFEIYLDKNNKESNE